MAGNTALDFVIGAVPLLGDVFDATFTANLRNIALMRQDLLSRSDTLVARAIPGGSGDEGHSAPSDSHVQPRRVAPGTSDA